MLEWIGKRYMRMHQIRQTRRGLHPDRAHGRRRHHRHPRCDSHPDVPQPAREGQGGCCAERRSGTLLRLPRRVLQHSDGDYSLLRHHRGPILMTSACDPTDDVTTTDMPAPTSTHLGLADRRAIDVDTRQRATSWIFTTTAADTVPGRLYGRLLI